MGVFDNLPVVREGVWLYAGSVPVRVRILSSPEMFGSGDYEDDEAVREDQPAPCLILAYEAAGSPGNFCNVVPNIPALESALALAESLLPGIEWKA